MSLTTTSIFDDLIASAEEVAAARAQAEADRIQAEENRRADAQAEQAAATMATTDAVSTAEVSEALKRWKQEQQDARNRRCQEADAAYKAAESRKRIIDNLGSVFFPAIRKYLISKIAKKEREPSFIKDVVAYSQALASPDATELPKIDPHVAAEIQSMFVHEFVLAVRRGRPFPDDLFFGQRQDWFQPALDETLGTKKDTAVVITPPSAFNRVAKSRVIHTTQTTPEKVLDPNKGPAVTLRQKKPRNTRKK